MYQSINDNAFIGNKLLIKFQIKDKLHNILKRKSCLVN